MNSGARYPHLPHAPIIEAVIDWRVKLPATLDVTTLKQAGESFGPKYRFGEEERQFQFEITQVAGAEAESTSRRLGPRGYRFRSQDGLEIAVLSKDGFSFSRLRPYTQWETVFSEATRLWTIYRASCQPEEISRIATRYVNRILFPLPLENFGKYLTVPPAVPPDAPQIVGSLLSRVVLDDPQTGISTTVTQVIEGPPEQGRLPFILDIDAYIVKTIQPNAGEIVSRFAALREMKNRVFFATLTNDAIEMFK